MKKILLSLIACLIVTCSYANTCKYSNVEVSLYSEVIEVDAIGNAYIEISVNDDTKNKVRCQVEIKGKRVWIDVNLVDGRGRYNIRHYVCRSFRTPVFDGVGFLSHKALLK